MTRHIDDLRQNRRGHLSGQACWRPAGQDLAYSEAGQLTYGDGAPMRATRRYLWRAEPGGVAVYYEDGRAFHSFALGQRQVEARHDCPPDLYQVSYDFTAWPNWRAVWMVWGPGKDYQSVTDYWRETA